ncbi:MAG: ubiquinol-cytochrome c reductase iron-sulfur subunit [Candidatus Nanopelagicales bacterium]
MTDEPTHLTRRDALRGAAALCGLSLLALGITDAQADTDGTQKTRSGQVRVQLSKYPALKKVGGAAYIGTVGDMPAAVVRTGTSTYAAYSLLCPHAGVTVQRSGTGWLCPAHASRFTVTGEFVSGPAGVRLGPIPSRLSGKVLIVG